MEFWCSRSFVGERIRMGLVGLIVLGWMYSQSILPNFQPFSTLMALSMALVAKNLMKA